MLIMNVLLEYNIVIVYAGGVDYNGGLYNITFFPWIVRTTFNISITDDSILEINEEFSLTINSTSLPTRIFSGNIQRTTILIADNDGKHTLK